MVSDFIIIYIAAILGVASYFYLPSVTREVFRVCVKKREKIPKVYFVVRLSRLSDYKSITNVYLSLEGAQKHLNSIVGKSGVYYYRIESRRIRNIKIKEDA